MLVETGHYPFVSDWDLDCRLLEEQISGVVADRERLSGMVTSATPVPALKDAVRINGHFETSQTPSGASS